MILAKYKGEEDTSPFKKGKIYFLEEPNLGALEWKIMVKNAEGAEWGVYSTIEAFLSQWEVIDTLWE